VLLILLDLYPTKQMRSACGVLLFLPMRLVYVQFRFVWVTSPVGKINHGTLQPFRDRLLCDFDSLAFHCFVWMINPIMAAAKTAFLFTRKSI
jgi:hypothetical protein